MHPYKALAVTATDTGEEPEIIMTMRAGDDATSACWATKRFGMERWDEVRDILGWASHAFLTAADQLSEDGWEIFHTADCAESHMGLADA